MHLARASQVPVRLRDLASASPTEEAAARVAAPPPDDGYSSDDSSDSSYDDYAARDRGEESSDSDSDESVDGAAEPAWVAAGESCFHNGAPCTLRSVENPGLHVEIDICRFAYCALAGVDKEACMSCLTRLAIRN